MRLKITLAFALATIATLSFWVLQTRLGGGVQRAQAASAGSFYDLKTTTLEGEPAALADHRGKVALVVNVASKCGLTPQYEALQELQTKLGDRGFTVLGFPSNDFMGQEPGTADEIRSFCSVNYGVTFPLYEKRHVKGDEKDDVYAYLTRELEEPTWNFTKYVVDRQGNVIARFSPRTKPMDPELLAVLEETLAESPATAE